jgi:hypothetical protein
VKIVKGQRVALALVFGSVEADSALNMELVPVLKEPTLTPGVKSAKRSH